MAQLDLILETYVHADAETVAPKVADPVFVRYLWPQWNVMVSEDRGYEGVRWILDDSRFTGSTEVWIESVAEHGCVLHGYVRVDARRGRITNRRRRRVRAVMMAEMWRFKDHVEGRGARVSR